MTYRIEQLRGKQWETVGGNVTPLQWKAIEWCTEQSKLAAHFPTRVFEVDTKLVPYYLDENGRRQYALEVHECFDCGSTAHSVDSPSCRVANYEEH